MTKIRKARESQIRERYGKLKSVLSERARRQFVANQAIDFGYGGIAVAVRATCMAPSVIGRGIAEVRAIEDGTAPSLPPTRSRRPGGGRKKTAEKDPSIGATLGSLLVGATPLVDDAKVQRYVNRAGHWLAMQSERPGLGWRFGVLDTDSINAFAAPGGRRPSERWAEFLPHSDRNRPPLDMETSLRTSSEE